MLSQDELVRASRMYHTNKDAAAALGCTAAGYSRACRQKGVATAAANWRQRTLEHRIESMPEQ